MEYTIARQKCAALSSRSRDKSEGRFRHATQSLLLLDGDRRDLAGLEIADPDRVVVLVGDVEFVAEGPQARRLVEAGLLAVRVPALPVADERPDRAGRRVADLDLVVVAVGAVELPPGAVDADHMLHADLVSLAVLVAELEETHPHDRPRAAFRIEVHLANAAHLGVVHVQLAVHDRKPARLRVLGG